MDFIVNGEPVITLVDHGMFFAYLKRDWDNYDIDWNGNGPKFGEGKTAEKAVEDLREILEGE